MTIVTLAVPAGLSLPVPEETGSLEPGVVTPPLPDAAPVRRAARGRIEIARRGLHDAAEASRRGAASEDAALRSSVHDRALRSPLEVDLYGGGGHRRARVALAHFSTLLLSRLEARIDADGVVEVSARIVVPTCVLGGEAAAVGKERLHGTRGPLLDQVSLGRRQGDAELREQIQRDLLLEVEHKLRARSENR